MIKLDPNLATMGPPQLKSGDVRGAAEQFEGLLLGELFKVMRQTVPESSMLGSMSSDMFNGMLDEELARSASGQLGIADTIVNQLAPQDGALGKPPAAALDALMADGWQSPLTSTPSRLTEGQRFGAARPGDRPDQCGDGHCGVDLAKPEGTPVHAVRAGEVLHVQRDPDTSGGLSVTLRHGKFVTRYLHLSSVSAELEKGGKVAAGLELGAVGDTGTSSDGSHLHFELSYRDGAANHRIDPTPFLRRWGQRAP